MTMAKTAENAHALAQRTKEFSPAMWEALEELGATAAEVVENSPEIGWADAELELRFARERRQARDREVRERLKGAEPIFETWAQQRVNSQLRSLWRSSSSGKIGGDCMSDTEALADRLGSAVGELFS